MSENRQLCYSWEGMFRPVEKLSETDFKKIIRRRDPRYDGRFYFGVKTTRIYCRPVCPARPKPENILIFRSSAEAERAGYRPCKRCRPDTAPGSVFHGGTANTVGRALRLIGETPGDDLDVERLATSLGITDRHLRRLFDEQLGASPVEIMITKRLHLAKQLLAETDKPVTEIAFSAGFRSVRRFNEAFKQRYQVPPGALRGTPFRGEGALALKLAVRAPYDWPTVIGYLRRHETVGLERVTDNEYLRHLGAGKKIGSVRVRFAGNHLAVTLVDVPLTEVRGVLARVRVLFDTDHNPAHLPLVRDGIRVPGAFDPFEVAVSIILGQLVSTAQAKAKQQALVEKFGTRLTDGIFSFPSPAWLRDAPVEEIGITRGKAHAIRELARLVAAREISFGAADPARTLARLAKVKGIGPWTLSMIAMRCLHDADAFPANDLIIARALKARLVAEDEWRSSRAYLTHFVWRDFGALLTNSSRNRAPSSARAAKPRVRRQSPRNPRSEK